MGQTFLTLKDPIVSILTLECAPTEKDVGRQASGISFEAQEG